MTKQVPEPSKTYGDTPTSRALSIDQSIDAVRPARLLAGQAETTSPCRAGTDEGPSSVSFSSDAKLTKAILWVSSDWQFKIRSLHNFHPIKHILIIVFCRTEGHPTKHNVGILQKRRRSLHVVMRTGIDGKWPLSDL